MPPPVLIFVGNFFVIWVRKGLCAQYLTALSGRQRSPYFASTLTKLNMTTMIARLSGGIFPFPLINGSLRQFPERSVVGGVVAVLKAPRPKPPFSRTAAYACFIQNFGHSSFVSKLNFQ